MQTSVSFPKLNSLKAYNDRANKRYAKTCPTFLNILVQDF